MEKTAAGMQRGFSMRPSVAGMPDEISRLVKIRVNELVENAEGISNYISTTKFTLLTWLPISLGEQFRRFANIFFLVISVMLMIGTYCPTLWASPLDPWSTVLTLLFVMMVTSVKEGMEDLERAKHDSTENNRECVVVTFEDGKAVETRVPSHEIKGGDIVKLEGHCQVPVDFLIMLTSNYKDGNTCYIETANIDGETNLKVREAPQGLESKDGNISIDTFAGSVECELPNKNIHNFAGALELKARGEAIPLNVDNVIWRGSIFSNTDWAYGIAVYCGEETKVQLNNLQAVSKMSRVEESANSAIKCITVTMVATVTMSVIAIYASGFEDYDLFPYVFPPDTKPRLSVLPLWLEQWFIFFLLFNNFVPISLYVTLEMINVGQSYFIGQDVELYEPSIDSPCIVKSSNMCQELGMVSNIFSDKTGTLTRNEMVFKKAVINGKMYPIDAKDPICKAMKDDSGFKQSAVYAFMRCLALCHTVVREKDGTYRAESPDELALVEGVVHYGFELIERGTANIEVVMAGETQNFEVLAVNSFNSDRKRSSVLLHDSTDGSYVLLCKGADSIMISLCKMSDDTKSCVDKELLDLACEGLRTLVVSQKKLTKTEAMQWLDTYKEAARSMTDRGLKMDDAAAMIEQDMELLGITAIEDRLQDEVPECIASFIEAGIVVWMLTGDKEETAIQIALSCNLVAPTTEKYFISKNASVQEFKRALVDVHTAMTASENANQDKALVIDGPSFHFFDDTDPEQRAMLLAIGQASRSVVACRLTPIQKQMMVGLVKRDAVPATITLAIGDGANDVSMIKEANVGVGIIGKEGCQAANNADFAIGQFRFLKRLMFVHGRNNYMRAGRTFLYSIHKNFTLTITLVWFSFFTALSGTSLYESNVYTAFNLMLGLPIVMYGVFNKDVDDDFAMKNPWIYCVGRDNEVLNPKMTALWGLNATFYAIVIALSGYYIMEKSFHEYGIYEFGTHVFLTLVFALQVKVSFIHHLWNVYHAGSMIISITGTFLFVLGVSVALYSFYGEAEALYSRNLFWLTAVFTVPITCALIDLVGQAYLEFFEPTKEKIIGEIYQKHCGVRDDNEIHNMVNALVKFTAGAPHGNDDSATSTEGVRVELTGNTRLSHHDGQSSPDVAHGMFSDYLVDDKIVSNRGSVRNISDQLGDVNEL